MPIILYFYAIGILLAGALNTLFGFSVYIKNRKNISSITYALLSVAFAVWCYSWFAMLLVSNNEQLALFFARLLNFGAVFIPAFYFHWITSILEIEKENKKNIWACYILTIFFAVLSWMPSYVSGVRSVLFFPYWPTAGFLYAFYLIFAYFTFPTYGVYLLFKNLRSIDKNDKNKRNQIRYVLLGTLMGFGGGALNFFLIYNINPFGSFFEAGIFVVLLAFVPFAVPLAYATMKYHLMDIKLVLTEIVAGLVSTTLLIDFVFSIFTSANPLVILFKFAMFVIFSYFGILLIRSVIKEIEQREKIEKIEKELEKAYEVEKKALEFEKEYNKRLQEFDKIKNQFLAQVQHDVRSPLTKIMWTADLFLGGHLGKQSKKTLEEIKKIQEVAQDMRDKANSFLDTAQFRLGKAPLQLEPGVGLKSILEETVNELKFKSDSKKIYLKLAMPENEINMIADREKLKSAIFNIVDNAIKFTDKGGVSVKAENDDKIVKIIISDTGIGIPADKVKTIFEQKFERTEQAQKTTEGKGVGLYLSGQIIKYHQGKAWVESEGEDKGSTFYIELPLNIDEKTLAEQSALIGKI
ncbi:MAG: HATPase domain-containing multisensor signal transduction histidine kinase [Berkelbacteria bacterium GW2011_GWA1_36_9]|uniref:histidine kinase n=1 Tax=Berkelbacteria bacterium GW2011_GWA1_36_9 TaxID=1618331 RepID=A0A0G0FFB7_9BACT|nr:MAG: HATPase domain-containing multisensor signal transduction histidine kinase [Berkelbacteria bacterium GW2011_GWA1_36_9]